MKQTFTDISWIWNRGVRRFGEFYATVNPRQLILASGACVYLTVLVLLTHIPLNSELNTNDASDHWSEDKLVHFGAYASLAAIITAMPMVRVREDVRITNDQDLALIGMIAAGITVVAALDEFTQPWFGRSMTLTDWFADVVGIAAGQAFAITVCMTVKGASDFASDGESASLVTSFIGEDDDPDQSFAAAQPGASWLHLAAIAYSAEMKDERVYDNVSNESGEWVYEGATRAEIDSQMADGQGEVGYGGHDRLPGHVDRVDSSGAPEGKSSSVDRGSPGTGGQLLPAGGRAESMSDAGRVGHDLLVWDDARR